MKLDLQGLFQFINSKLNIVLSYIENAYIRNYSSKKFVYEIKDCHKNNDGKQIIVAKIVNSPKSVFSMPAIDSAIPNMSYAPVTKIFNATIIQKYTQNL